MCSVTTIILLASGTQAQESSYAAPSSGNGRGGARQTSVSITSLTYDSVCDLQAAMFDILDDLEHTDSPKYNQIKGQLENLDKVVNHKAQGWFIPWLLDRIFKWATTNKWYPPRDPEKESHLDQLLRGWGGPRRHGFEVFPRTPTWEQEEFIKTQQRQIEAVRRYKSSTGDWWPDAGPGPLQESALGSKQQLQEALTHAGSVNSSPLDGARKAVQGFGEQLQKQAAWLGGAVAGTAAAVTGTSGTRSDDDDEDDFDEPAQEIAKNQQQCFQHAPALHAINNSAVVLIGLCFCTGATTAMLCLCRSTSAITKEPLLGR